MTDPFPFHITLRVRFSETDAQGHVFFGQYLDYFDTALIEYLRSIGYSYQQMLAEGIDMFYVDSHASYHSPAYFDEALRVHCRIGHIGNTSIRFEFQIFAEADGRDVAMGEITAVMKDHQARQKTRVPKALRAHFAG